jgi:tetratricopeptide (TPR) repeat protein
MVSSRQVRQIAVAAAIQLSLVAAVAAFQVHAGEYPSWSRERAALLEDWRTKLEAAEELSEREEFDRAEALYLELLDDAARSESEGLLVARAADGLADLYRLQERPSEAAELYRRAVAMWDRLLGPGQPRLAVTLHNLGTVCLKLGERGEAERHLKRALAIWEESYGVDSPQAENSRRALRAAAALSARAD